MSQSSLKKAIIVGASSGIGNSLARIMSARGYELGLTGRRRNLLDELGRNLPNPAIIKDFDIAKSEEAMVELEKLIKEMGGVDVIVINAGVGQMNPELNWEIDKLIFDVNIKGFSAMANVAFKYFKKQSKGHIVGISSIIALQPSGRAASYSASKTYVSAYMDCLRNRAAQLSMPITITDVKPGFVQTPMTEGNRHMFWVASSDKAAGQIADAIESKVTYAYVTRRWRFIAWLMRLLPTFILRKQL